MIEKHVGYGIDNDFDLYCINDQHKIIAHYDEEKGEWHHPETPFPVYHDVSPVTEESMLRRTEGRYPDAHMYDEINSPLKKLLDAKARELCSKAYHEEYEAIKEVHPDWCAEAIADDIMIVSFMNYRTFVKEVKELLLKEIDEKYLTSYLWMYEHAMPRFYLLDCKPEDVVNAILCRGYVKSR